MIPGLEGLIFTAFSRLNIEKDDSFYTSNTIDIYRIKEKDPKKVIPHTLNNFTTTKNNVAISIYCNCISGKISKSCLCRFNLVTIFNICDKYKRNIFYSKTINVYNSVY
jgi:hypothetical protein